MRSMPVAGLALLCLGACDGPGAESEGDQAGTPARTARPSEVRFAARDFQFDGPDHSASQAGRAAQPPSAATRENFRVKGHTSWEVCRYTHTSDA